MVSNHCLSIIKEAVKISFADIFKLGMVKQPIQINCPFKERHIAGDLHKSARYYPDTNIIVCFAENKSWDVVSLFAEKLDKSNYETAKLLLKKYKKRSNNLEILYQNIKKNLDVENNNIVDILYLGLEDSFKMPEIRRFVIEQKELLGEYKDQMFDCVSNTAKDLLNFIETCKNYEQV